MKRHPKESKNVNHTKNIFYNTCKELLHQSEKEKSIFFLMDKDVKGHITDSYKHLQKCSK